MAEKEQAALRQANQSQEDQHTDSLEAAGQQAESSWV